jgi:hypothetical protein
MLRVLHTAVFIPDKTPIPSDFLQGGSSLMALVE